MTGNSRRILLEDVLNEKQVHHIVKEVLEADVWTLKGSLIRPASDGLAGFLGDHLRASLQVTVDGKVKDIHLFIKCLPTYNAPKAEFIDSHHYFRRESLMFKVLEDLRVKNDPNPWCPKAYIYTDTMIVMPDLALDGYSSRYYLHTLDFTHVMLGAATIAKFHAAFTNYETKKSLEIKQPYNINNEYGHILAEPTFCDSPWMRACAKLTANFIKAFSSKSYKDIPNLEKEIAKQYLVACDSLTECKGTLNVLIHKDLWVNNLMYKDELDVPSNAIMVDFQLLRYAPPAFDLMTFIYLTTSRKFRDEHETEIYNHYYSIFCDNLDEDSKQRMADLGYDRTSFLSWCEKARMFGVLEPATIHPFILMHPKAAEKTFDDPETYEKYINEDRTEPVLEYAQKCNIYRDRLLEVSEEFVERYVLDKL